MFDQFARQLDADHPRAEHQHIHVVVLDTLARRVSIVAKPGADSGKLVGRHRRADAAAANQHAAFGSAVEHSPPDRLGKIRIVHRSVAIGAFIDHLMSLPAQILGNDLFQIEAGMIRANDNAHGLFSYQRGGALDHMAPR